MSWICVFSKTPLLRCVKPVILNTKKIVTFESDDEEADPMMSLSSDPVTMIRCEGAIVRVPGTVDAVATLIMNNAGTLEDAIASYLKAFRHLQNEEKKKKTEEA